MPLAVSPTRYGLIRGCSHPKGMTTRRRDELTNRKKRKNGAGVHSGCAGGKEEVVSHLATEHHQSYANVKLVDLREGATSAR